MILLGSSLVNSPVLSLQTGGPIGQTTTAVVDPGTLKVVAYEVSSQLRDDSPLVVRIVDVREMSDLGLIIDSIDELENPADIIKLNDIYKLGFNPIGMNVTDERRHKLGRVVDYTIGTSGFYIQQLTVKRPLFKSFSDTELLIHRSQIIEINNSAIVVHSEAKAPEPELHEVIGSYVNPFRKPSETAPDSIETKQT